LNTPERLKLKQIENFFVSEWFIIKEWWRWSHRKVVSKETNRAYNYPVHQGKVKKEYHKELLKFYKFNT
jgi:hypothetical protein